MNICFFGLFFDSFTPNTRTRFSPYNFYIFTTSASKFSRVLRAVIKKCRPHRVTNHETLLIC